MPQIKNHRRPTEAVTLRTVADRVGLAPCSVSAILNNSAAALSIPQHTKERVLRAAAFLNSGRPTNTFTTPDDGSYRALPSSQSWSTGTMLLMKPL